MGVSTAVPRHYVKMRGDIMIRQRKYLILLGLLCSAGSSVATEEWIKNTNVERLLLHGTLYGGCLAKVSTNPTDILPNCGKEWITFDCLTVFPESTKAAAQLKFDAAQLAYVTGNPITLRITDERKANGKCLATQVYNN